MYLTKKFNKLDKINKGIIEDIENIKKEKEHLKVLLMDKLSVIDILLEEIKLISKNNEENENNKKKYINIK